MSYRNSKTIDIQIKQSLTKKVALALKKGVTLDYVEELKDRVVDRTKLGIGVSESGKSERLKPLSQNYKEVRSGEAFWFTKNGKVVKVGGSKQGEEPKKPKKRRRKGRGRKLIDKVTKLFKQGKGIPSKPKKKKKKAKRLRRLHKTTTPSKSNLTATGQLLKSLTVVKIKLKSGIAYIITVGDKRGLDLHGKPSKIGNKQLVNFLAGQGRTFMGFTRSQQNKVTKEIRQILVKYLK